MLYIICIIYNHSTLTLKDKVQADCHNMQGAFHNLNTFYPFRFISSHLPSVPVILNYLPILSYYICSHFCVFVEKTISTGVTV